MALLTLNLFSIEVLTPVNPIPVPSPIHYELPLQILEQQTLRSVARQPDQRQLANELAVTLRKALALQKRLEESCAQSRLEVDHRWSVGEQTFDTSKTPKT